jgi:hypothetical protein
MSHHPSASCPHCQSSLRIKPEYYGLEVVCKFCHEPFVLKPPSEVRASGPDEEKGREPSGPSALERLWEDETARAAQPRPAKPVRQATPKPALARRVIDLEDSSMLIPVRKDDGGTAVAEMPPKPESSPLPEIADPEPGPSPDGPGPEPRRELQVRALRQEIERRERRVEQVEAQVRVERAEIERLRAELGRVERD